MFEKYPWLGPALYDGAKIAVAAFLTAIGALNLVFPGSIAEAKAEALLVVSTAGPVVLTALGVWFRAEILPRILPNVFGKAA